MHWVLLAALFGGVSVLLQAQSARAEHHSGHLGLLASLIRRPRYLVGLGCMALGFVCAVLALRHLPLFAVQAGRASSLGVTALLAVFVLGARLRPRDWASIGGMAIGLVAIGLSTGHGHAQMSLPGLWRWTPLVAVLLLLWGGQVLSRSHERWVGPALAVASGLAFTVVGLCVRGIAGARGLEFPAVLQEPLLWTLPVAGFAGLHLSALALTRASLVSVTSALLASEIVGAALLGMLIVGDRTRPGLGWLAAVGVGLVLVGAVALARFGAALEGTEEEAGPADRSPAEAP